MTASVLLVAETLSPVSVLIGLPSLIDPPSALVGVVGVEPVVGAPGVGMAIVASEPPPLAGDELTGGEFMGGNGASCPREPGPDRGVFRGGSTIAALGRLTEPMAPVAGLTGIAALVVVDGGTNARLTITAWSRPMKDETADVLRLANSLSAFDSDGQVNTIAQRTLANAPGWKSLLYMEASASALMPLQQSIGASRPAINRLTFD